MAEPPIKFSRPAATATKLNAALGQRVREITGDGLITANRAGDSVALGLNVNQLATRIPRFSTVVVKITAAATGGGWYAGKIGIRNSTAMNPDTAGAVDYDTLYTLPAADDCYIFSVAEEGANTHAIAAGTWREDAVVRGVVAGKSVVILNGGWGDLPAAGDQWTVLTAVTAGVWGVDLVHAAEEAPVP